jgi:hypothetical protein
MRDHVSRPTGLATAECSDPEEVPRQVCGMVCLASCTREKTPLLRDRVLHIRAKSVAALIIPRYRANPESTFQRHDRSIDLEIDCSSQVHEQYRIRLIDVSPYSVSLTEPIEACPAVTC